MKSLLEKTEVSRARVGPRELKDPTSREYAIQTLYALKRYAESLRCDQELVARELDEIETYRHWEVLGYPTKEAYFEAELNEVGRLNIQKVEAAGKHGGDRRSEGRNQGNNVNLKPRKGNSMAYIVARLKRDRPDLVEKLASGEIKSARAAGIAAGFIKVLTPFQAAQKAVLKLNERDLTLFVQWFRTLSKSN